MGTNTKFNCNCGLTDEEIFDDIASLVKLTGSESDTELEMLHQSIFHSDDHDVEDDSPTTEELLVKAKRDTIAELYCNRCTAHRGHNKIRKKHGVQKPRYKDKR